MMKWKVHILLKGNRVQFRFCIRYSSRLKAQACKLGLLNHTVAWILSDLKQRLTGLLPGRPYASSSLSSSPQSKSIRGRGPNKLIQQRQLQPVRPIPRDIFIFIGLVLSSDCGIWAPVIRLGQGTLAMLQNPCHLCLRVQT